MIFFKEKTTKRYTVYKQKDGFNKLYLPREMQCEEIQVETQEVKNDSHK
jgi:hypothetical protein